MKKTEIYKKTLTTMVLALLIISSTFLVFSNSAVPIAKAVIPSDLLQYEWIQSAVDGSRSCFNPGPGPTTPHIKWRTTIEGLTGQPVAFNGKVFVQDTSVYYGAPGLVPSTYCLDAATGETIYKLDGILGSICKLDNTYMLIGSNCYRIADGSLAWEGPPGFSYAQNIFTGLGYIAELNLVISGSTAWDISDPSQPPTLAWYRGIEPDFEDHGSESAKVYGSGVVVYTTSYQYIRGINATTGKTLWTTATKVNDWTYGASAHAGVFGFGSLNGNFYGWNITTGELMWTYNTGTFFNQFASASGAAYGMFYEKNQDTHVYAINATTGELVWKYKGPGVAYSNTLTIAGGKVYAMTGENQYVDFATGEPGHSEFACLDAYTGEVIWTEPFENGAPFNLQCNAYGNLYIVPTISTYTPGVFTYSGFGSTYAGPNEIWCISDTPQDWPMFLNDPENSGYGDGPTNLQLKWTTTTGGGMVSSPTLVNGVAYLTSYDGNIYAFNADTGTQLWNYSVGTIGLSSTVAIVNNRLYTGAGDGNVYCLDAETGTKLWQADAGGVRATGSPTVVGDSVYVTGDTDLYCFNAINGNKIWNVTFPGGGTMEFNGFIFVLPGAVGPQTPVVIDGAVYIGAAIPGGAGPHVLKLDATTGDIIYDTVIPGYYWGTGMTASVTVGGGMVFARTQYRYNYALNATTGEIIWMIDGRYNPGTPEQATGAAQNAAMLYKYGIAYFPDYFGVTAINALNGSEIWHTYLARENAAQGLSYSYGRVYTVNEAGVIYVLDALTGEKQSFYQTGGAMQLHSVPTPYNGSLYLSSLDWNLYCFEEAPPPEPYKPQPEPTFPTADEIAQKVLDNLPDSPSANDIAGEILNQLPEYPEAPTAEEVAQETINQLPEYPEAPTAEEVTQEILNRLPEPTVVPEYTTIDIVIIVAVVVVAVLVLYTLYTVKKQK